ncbi:MAG: flagellar hook-associated protein FlgL [Nitrosomonadales bacterium]|nr:flagellar hook-associated protein FlgL [Nitrosomonadales bacterium]
MRISSSAIYDLNITQMGLQQYNLTHTQLQLATGRRMVTPADDPAAAARALEVSQSDATNNQYAANRVSASNTLGQSAAVLQNITTLLHNMKSSIVAASNQVLTDSERKAAASDLTGQLQTLLGEANATDGAGTYLFSGFQGATKPFVQTAAGVQYQGDDGQRMAQVSVSRQFAMTDPGSDVFMRVKSGNGTFFTNTAATNTGSGITSQGVVLTPSLVTGNNYQVNFTVAAGATSYTVTNATTGAAVLPSTPYVSGQAIAFDGIQFDIKGAPANGDSFTVAPSTNQDIFKTITDAITALNTPVIPSNAASSASLAQSMGIANAGIDAALNRVLTVQASVGARLNELDVLKSSGDMLSVQFRQTLSTLQDVDAVKALSDLDQQKLSLQAAQKSFVQVSGLSLFNYM